MAQEITITDVSSRGEVEVRDLSDTIGDIITDGGEQIVNDDSDVIETK